MTAMLTSGSRYQAAVVFYLLFIPLVQPELVKTAFTNRFKGQFAGIASTRLSLFIAATILMVLLVIPEFWGFGILTLLLVALPEEWFFRGFLQRSLGNGVIAIVFVSCVFSITHGLTTSWTLAALVFIPSLVFGFVYWKSASLLLVILLHTLANLLPKLALHYFPDAF